MKKISQRVVLVFYLLFFTTGVLASTGGEIDNPIQNDDIEVILTNLLGILVKLGGVVLAIMIVYTGFLFVRSSGNEDRLKEAKSSLTYVIIGGAIVLGALGIQQVIESTMATITAP